MNEKVESKVMHYPIGTLVCLRNARGGPGVREVAEVHVIYTPCAVTVRYGLARPGRSAAVLLVDSLDLVPAYNVPAVRYETPHYFVD